MNDLSLGVNVVELSRQRYAELIREAEVDRMLRSGRPERSVWAALRRLVSRHAQPVTAASDCPEPVTA